MRLLSKRNLLVLAAGLMTAALSGCSSAMVDPAAEATAKQAYRLFCSGDDAKLEAMFIPEARTPNFHAQLERIRLLVPKGAPPEPKLVNWQVFAGTGGVLTTLVHAYGYPDTTANVTTVLTPGAGKGRWLIRSFNVNVTVSQNAAATGASSAPAAPSPDAARPAAKP